MEITILDTEFVSRAVIDTYESLIWTDRYRKYGDFELFLPTDLNLLQHLNMDYYVWTSESEHQMIIDAINITSDVEAGNKMKISGKSLERILAYRIVWEQTNIEGNLQSGIIKLLDESIVNPEIYDRKIPNFKYELSTDPTITSLTVDRQFTGDNLYDVIVDLCEVAGIGFKIIMNDKNEFIFKLYNGVDRSYAQDVNPYVVFSPKFDNLINSNYLESNSVFKNVALVAGEGEGVERRTVSVGSGTGLSRRELFVDRRDISSQIHEEQEDGSYIQSEMPVEEYNAKLTQAGKATLSEDGHRSLKVFEGNALPEDPQFIYKKDFLMGDIVQFENEYGVAGRVRIPEIIFSNDAEGYQVIPSFDMIKEE